MPSLKSQGTLTTQISTVPSVKIPFQSVLSNGKTSLMIHARHQAFAGRGLFRSELPHQFSERAANRIEIRLDALTWDDNQIERLRQGVLFEPKDLTNDAFPAIALMRFTDFFRDDQPQSRNTQPVGHAINDKHPVGPRRFAGKHTIKVTPLAQVHGLGKTKLQIRRFIVLSVAVHLFVFCIRFSPEICMTGYPG